jgi:putative translation initiation inhibitor, yjgF family protein
VRIGIISENYFYSEEDDMTQIQRIDTNDRLAEAVIYQGVAYFAGQVPETSVEQNTYEQTKEILTLIDKLLEKIHSHKRRILNAQIFLANMQDYALMNQAWDEWVDVQNPPARATVEAKLADPRWKVEIVITAAV